MVVEIPHLRADAQRNLERILEAARAVFARDGLDASVADVAERAGVGTATIFRRFPTKDDLVAAMIEYELETFGARAREALESAAEILIGGVDLAIVGHQDLTQSLGIPGEYASPIFREAFEKVRALCAARGIALAGLAATPEDLQAVVESGSRFILYGTDLVLMRREAERAVRALAPLRKLAARVG